MRRGIGCRRGWDPALLWLWRRAAAMAPIRPLAWEPPYALGVALGKANQINNQINKPPFVTYCKLTILSFFKNPYESSIQKPTKQEGFFFFFWFPDPLVLSI